ncbi:hypothetical protein [Nocardioides marmoraquaticus]
MKPRYAHRWAPLVAAGLLLTGCGLSDPGTAASVGDERISVADVQRYARGFCAFTAPGVATGQVQALPLASQKQGIVQVLTQGEVAEQAAEARGVAAPGQVTQYLLSQVRPGLEQMTDADEREDATDFFTRYLTGQATIAALAADETGQQLGPDNLDQLLQAGSQQLLPDLVGAADVSVDPRYGLGDDLSPTAGDASVSQPVSDLAVQLAGGGQDGGPSATEALPPSQRCGG